MLKCKIDRKKGIVKIRTEKKTDARNVSVETLALIKTIYEGIKEKNPEAAKEYKLTIIGSIIDPKSPVWKVDEKAAEDSDIDRRLTAEYNEE